VDCNHRLLMYFVEEAMRESAAFSHCPISVICSRLFFIVYPQYFPTFRLASNRRSIAFSTAFWNAA
jgi:hypothetical protein